MDSTITSGIINYPILYFNHYHQQEIVTQVIKATNDLFPEFSAIDPSDKDRLKSKARVKIIDFNNLMVNSGVLWADSPSFEEIDKKNLEWMYTKQLRAIIQEMEIEDEYSSIDDKPCVYIFRSTPYNLLEQNAEFIAYLHKFVSLYECWQDRKRDINWTIVLIVPSGELPPPSIEGVVRLISITPPDKGQIMKEIDKFFKGSAPNEKEEFCKSLQGLQLYDVRQIIRSTKTIIGNTLSYRSVKWARDEKQQIIRKTGILKVVIPDVTFDDIGGLDNLKKDLKNKAKIFKHLSLLQDKRIGCHSPKGILLIGMPGCGKSMIAKAVASEFELPLLQLEMGKLLGQYVGQSETNLRRALDVADSAHPCILWIDEIEKAFAGTSNTSGDNNDLMMRLMGTFLTWMQERTNPVYIVATANDVMKPELMRKGRFDEVYFVDFPNTTERAAIARAIASGYEKEKDSIIHFAIDWNTLAKNMRDGTAKNDIGLSGAEIRSLIDKVVEEICIKRIDKMDKQSQKEAIDFDDFIMKENGGKIIISMDDFIDSLDEFKHCAMVKQSLWLFREAKEGNDMPNEDDRKNNFIDRIYSVQKQYQFKPAD